MGDPYTAFGLLGTNSHERWVIRTLHSGFSVHAAQFPLLVPWKERLRQNHHHLRRARKKHLGRLDNFNKKRIKKKLRLSHLLPKEPAEVMLIHLSTPDAGIFMRDVICLRT